MSTKPFEYAAKLDYAGKTAAIIGGGVIGASWAALFAANGLNVVISDPDPDIETKAHARIAAALPTLVALGHAPFDIAERVRFVVNRLQAAIFRECVALVRGGVVTIDELDDIVTTSLGVRLASSGPFLSLHLGGEDGGPPHSIAQLGPPMERLWETLDVVHFDPATLDLIARQADQSYGAWPIEQLAQIREAKEIAVLNALAEA